MFDVTLRLRSGAIYHEKTQAASLAGAVARAKVRAWAHTMTKAGRCGGRLAIADTLLAVIWGVSNESSPEDHGQVLSVVEFDPEGLAPYRVYGPNDVRHGEVAGNIESIARAILATEDQAAA